MVVQGAALKVLSSTEEAVVVVLVVRGPGLG
jgi:hypothetical protein